MFTLIFTCQFSFAEDLSSDEKDSSSRFRKALVGVHLISHRYVEPSLRSDSGLLYGVFGRYIYRLGAESEGVIDAELAAGKLNYDGAICKTVSGMTTCSPYQATTTDVILRVSHRFNFIISEQLDAFAGGGFRYLLDRGLGAGFYTRAGTYLFLPLGLTVKFPFKNKSVIALDLEYDFFLIGTMRSSLSEADPRLSDVSHTQKQGSGSKISLSYEGWDRFSGKLFYEHWAVADSDVQPSVTNGVPDGGYFIEPKNFTDSYGIGFGFKF